MNTYEISLWEDFPDTTSSGIPFLNERKLCVIGSHLMSSQARAREPKMINNINGTNTFTFKIFYTYIDELTGEKVTNPFKSLLINERKVKVLWKDKWYDLIIKNIDEDKIGNSATYTCKDIFITELSKNGYNIELTSELQNNSGTCFELAEQVLQGSGWTLNKEKSSKIYQYLETPVYESMVENGELIAYQLSAEGESSPITIPVNSKVLISKQSLDMALTSSNNTKKINIIYANGNSFITYQNEMVVKNGVVYYIYCNLTRTNNNYILTQNATTLNADIISTSYRGKELIESQKTIYDPIFSRYVGIYKDEQNNREVYGFSHTEFSNPSMVVNLIANNTDFQNTTGWLPVGNNFNLEAEIYPGLQAPNPIGDWTPDDYLSKGYLKIPGTGVTMGRKSNIVYNSGLVANTNILTPTVGEITNGETGGFHKGDKYIFRVKAKQKNSSGALRPDGVKNYLRFGVYEFNSNYEPISNSNYFDWPTNGQMDWETDNTGWASCVITCIKTCTANDLSKVGLFFTNQYQDAIFIENIQFFKLQKGATTYGEEAEEVVITPGDVALQGIANTIYKYYLPDHGGKTDPKDIEFLYSGLEDSPDYTPIMTFEKITTIEAKGSNRFNILQSIAENFECWIRFNIPHDNRGYMLLDYNGLPKKEVYLVENVGRDLGWSFIYGLDLKGIKRKIISEDIVSKTIVLANENEFAKNGFCSIERSEYNYPKENFILNFDYYVDQGLLNRRELELDLYNTNNGYIGYYTNLHDLNTSFLDNTNELVQKKKDLNRQEPELMVLETKIHTTIEEIDKLKQDAIYLANINDYNEIVDYLEEHNNKKVKDIVATIGRKNSELQQYQLNYVELSNAVTGLKEYISQLQEIQNNIIASLKELHNTFFKKYSRYIQEGIWQSNDYIDDNKYYFDAYAVAHTSSRPKIEYDINIIRLNYLEDFVAKKFNVGDICYIQDKDFFGTVSDDGTPFKLQIVISEITSYFDSPEKDVIKVQNYKTQFEDLFQRITATTQTLQYSSGGFTRAANAVNPNKTLNFDLLQKTFDYNNNFILNTANQDVTWDATGITIKDTTNSSQLVRITSGGLFITNDGGITWKNAIRGDGISADILTAGRINVGEIYIYNKDAPSFRWDSNGITAYSWDQNGVNSNKFVRHDQFGFYGYDGKNDSTDFIPSNINDIIDKATFGLTWDGFFMKSSDANGSVVINSNSNEVIKVTKGNDSMFSVSKNGDVTFAGTLNGATGTFSGELSAATGTFSGELSAATGTFNGELSAATGTFSGSLVASDDNNGAKITLAADGSLKIQTKRGSGAAYDDKVIIAVTDGGTINYYEPYIQLGIGTNSSYRDSGIIQKIRSGLYIGSGPKISKLDNNNGHDSKYSDYPAYSSSTAKTVNRFASAIYIRMKEATDEDGNPLTTPDPTRGVYKWTGTGTTGYWEKI